ncbi:hypothetical protein Rhal01_01658 [Rubritalea halochordaticola]|uniref:N-acetyltransferase domain-containing protein n=1 Tax=Rubritalea halochordaticola TaxID=714537 RepID=A0ABP9UYF4_9BACT
MLVGPLLTIRADASYTGGTGHIMRTLALAQQWIKRGGRCTYLTHHLPEQLHQRLTEEQCNIRLIETSPGSRDDAAETSTLLQELHPHCLLIDGYHLALDYQKQLTLPERTLVACISDFGTEDFHQPNVVIHANAKTTASYGNIPENTTLLAGPEFILLRDELLCTKPAPTAPESQKILITLGGSDPMEAAFSLITHLESADLLEGREFRIVLGPAYPKNGLAHTIKHPNVTRILSPTSLAPHYLWADTAICSPSTTAFELAHYGLPTGLITTADNQTKVLEAFQELRAALSLGDCRQTPHLETNSLRSLLLEQSTRSTLAQNARTLIDGKGTARICDVLGLPLIQLRKARLEDAYTLWEWANDPVTRASSFQSDPIPWENHCQWLEDSIGNPQRHLLLATGSKDEPLAQCRFDQSSPAVYIISISLSPHIRGTGLAPLIIRKASQHLKSSHPSITIEAWIKIENSASVRSFERAGYSHTNDSDSPNRLKMIF